jgi:hypothetical protein
MLDDRTDDLLRDAAREYNDPPPTPRDAMWERIIAERQKQDRKEDAGTQVLPLTPRRRLLPLRWAAGFAAVLAIGIALGRMTVEVTPGSAPTVAATGTPTDHSSQRVSTTAYQVATTEHLSQSEAFLTLFRASLQEKPGNQRLASATARQLLANNRLLLDSPAANDTKTKLLLQDLELVLAEIAQISPQSQNRDLDLINEGLERGGVMSRLRTAVPSGPSPTQGAL